MIHTNTPMPTDELRHAVEVARPYLTGVAERGYDAMPAISAQLYTYWFSKAGQAPGVIHEQFESPSLLARLRAAHAASGCYEAGWIVIATNGRGLITVERFGERLRLVVPDYVLDARQRRPVQPGDWVSVTTRRDYPDYENGWWMCHARVGAAPVAPMVRIYWNCPATAITTLVTRLTNVLEQAGVPYTFKCPLVTSLFGRIDGVVCYLAPSAYEILKPQLRAIHKALSPLLNDEVPPFTLRLGRGVAVAEDPANGQSFGQSRCDAVAASLIQASLSGVNDTTGLENAIGTGLPLYGISSERPYQSSSSPANLITTW